MTTKKKNIEFLRVTHLRGPNIWTYRPVIEVWLDIGELESYPSNTLPGFYDRLTALLPGLIEHRCGASFYSLSAVLLKLSCRDYAELCEYRSKPHQHFILQTMLEKRV